MINTDDLAAKMMVDKIGLRITDIRPSYLKHKSNFEAHAKETEWAARNQFPSAGRKLLLATNIKSSSELCIEGSVALLHQKHNIVSSGDVAMLAYTAVQECAPGLPLAIPVNRAAELVRGAGMGVTRIDTPVLMKKPAGLTSSAVINAMAMAGISAGLNTTLFVNETVYFDQDSQLATLKGSYKLAEICNSPKQAIPQTQNTGLLMEVARDTIRLEPVYRQKWLQRYFGSDGLLHPRQFTPEVLANMLSTLLSKYDLRRDIRRPLGQEELLAIPRQYRLAVMDWQNGYDVLKAIGGNKTELSRVTDYLNNTHSLNIKGPSPMEEISDRVELGDLLSPKNFMPVPAEIQADPTLFFTRDMETERDRIDALCAARLPEQA